MRTSPIPWLLLGYLPFIIALDFMPALTGLQIFAVTVAMSLVICTVLVGPQSISMGMKNDIPYLDVLKSMPVHGSQLVFGEIVGPFLILCRLVLMGFLLAFVAGGPRLSRHVDIHHRHLLQFPR